MHSFHFISHADPRVFTRVHSRETRRVANVRDFVVRNRAARLIAARSRSRLDHFGFFFLLLLLLLNLPSPRIAITRIVLWTSGGEMTMVDVWRGTTRFVRRARFGRSPRKPLLLFLFAMSERSSTGGDCQVYAGREDRRERRGTTGSVAKQRRFSSSTRRSGPSAVPAHEP